MNPRTSSLYRHFRRVSLEAVHYASPNRHCILAKLDQAFRRSEDISPEVLEKTTQFLRRASIQGQLENKIVKNLCYVHWSRSEYSKSSKDAEALAGFDPYEEYEAAIQDLNREYGIYIL